MFALTRNIVLTALSLSLYSCSRSPRCWGEDKNKGLILSSLDISCTPDWNDKEFRIDSDSALKRYFNQGCQIPSIDFNTQTLLGFYATGGCEIKFIREVKKNGNTYTYSIKVNECGTCKKLVYSYNWVIVPKIAASDQVTYQLK